MTYTLPFRQGDRVLEVGGGERPFFHPNLDIRAIPTVDIVADISQGLPLEDSSFDGLFAQYFLEHVSWRKMRDVVSEIHRILKPNGIAVLVTANLEEQCKLALDWFKDGKGEKVSEMIFGSQEFDNWDAGAHHCGFSPESATKLFKEAGFNRVQIVPHPVSKSDLIIEATKSGVVITRQL